MRIYTVAFENVAVSAAQDLFSVKGSSGKVCQLRRILLGATDTSLQTAQSLRLRIQYSSATITLGSGGATPTPAAVDPGDAAASFTAHTNDTTQATTSGAFTTQIAQGVHNYAGWDTGILTDQPVFGLNEGLAIDLLSTVSGTCHFSGTIWVAEMGS